MAENMDKVLSVEKTKQNTSKKEKAASTVKGAKSNETVKKAYRIVVRKLPVRQFTLEDFNNCLNKVCKELNLSKELFNVEHFVEGKISRKRGPVFGAGFIAVNDEQQYLTFLEQCPSKCSFIEVDDINSQPEVSAAPNQKAFRQKERVDKHSGSFEVDPDFLAFKAKLEKPVEKLQSAELQYDNRKDSAGAAASLIAQQIKNNPLLKFLREKGERKMQEKRALRDKARGLVSTALGGSASKALQVTGVMTKNGKTVRTKKPSSARAAATDDTTPAAQSGRGGTKEVRVLSKGAREPREPREGAAGKKFSSDSPLSASLFSVAPVSRSSGTAPRPQQDTDAGEAGVADSGKQSRRDRDRERDKLRRQQRAAEGTDTAVAPSGERVRPPREPREQREPREPREPRRDIREGGAEGRGPGNERNNGSRQPAAGLPAPPPLKIMQRRPASDTNN